MSDSTVKRIYSDDLYMIKDGSCVKIYGKIRVIRKMGGICFYHIYDQSGYCQIVSDTDTYIDTTVKKGDHICVDGIVRKDKYPEIQAKKITVVGTSNIRTQPAEWSTAKYEKLLLRSYVQEAVQTFFSKNGFLPVTSPTIVSNWVDGNTHSFSVDYYGNQCYLTLNNMLYHQIMLISGYQRIYEIAKVFRQDATVPKNRLSEFCTLDISAAFENGEMMMLLTEKLITELLSCMSGFKTKFISLHDNVKFDQIEYLELMKLSGCDPKNSGAQLPVAARKTLDKNFSSYVWVTGFPEEKRRFFVHSTNGLCHDYQLWFRGVTHFAMGSERETDLEVLKHKIIAEGKTIEQYAPVLSYYETGVPPASEIGFGFERFLMYATGGETITDYIAFPRNGRIFLP